MLLTGKLALAVLVFFHVPKTVTSSELTIHYFMEIKSKTNGRQGKNPKTKCIHSP